MEYVLKVDENILRKGDEFEIQDANWGMRIIDIIASANLIHIQMIGGPDDGEQAAVPTNLFGGRAKIIEEHDNGDNNPNQAFLNKMLE